MELALCPPSFSTRFMLLVQIVAVGAARGVFGLWAGSCPCGLYFPVGMVLPSDYFCLLALSLFLRV